MKKLVDNASENNDVKRVIADRAYDSKENFFRYLFDNGIEATIKVRKNSSHRSMGCYPRKVVSVLRQLKDLKKWKNSVSYGYRWIAETVFSSMKRMFDGEYVSARKYPNMVKEMILKASLYNISTIRK